jgi:hypothetical protein
LKKPQVADFREQIGATFQLNEENWWAKTLKFAVIVVRIKQKIPFIRHCLQQRARLFIHFHSYILEICVLYFNSFPTTDVYTRVYYHPSDRIDW